MSLKVQKRDLMMTYLSELVLEVLTVVLLLNECAPDSPEWYTLTDLKRSLLQFYMAASPRTRDIMEEDPTTVICVFDI